MTRPIITSCCGVTACLKCAVFAILDDDEKYDPTKKYHCCFCKVPMCIKDAGIDEKDKDSDVDMAKLLPNTRLR